MSFPKVKWDLGTDSGLRTNHTPARPLEFVLTECANHPRCCSGARKCPHGHRAGQYRVEPGQRTHTVTRAPTLRTRRPAATLRFAFLFGLRSIVIRRAAATRIAPGCSTHAGGSNTLETFHGFPCPSNGPVACPSSDDGLARPPTPRRRARAEPRWDTEPSVGAGGRIVCAVGPPLFPGRSWDHRKPLLTGVPTILTRGGADGVFLAPPGSLAI